MKSVLLFFLFLSAHFFLGAIDIDSPKFILMDAYTKQVIISRQADVKTFPASITKVGTFCYAQHHKPTPLSHLVTAKRSELAAISPQQKKKGNFKYPSYWIEFASSHVGLKVGERITIADLLHGMMLESGNDAANVLADFVSGSVPQFVKEMNEFLKDIGCKNTLFQNPHGLHHPEHYSTAYDLALMTAFALKDPVFSKVVSTLRYKKEKTNKQNETTFFQGNRLLKKGAYFYPYAIGVKTGYTTDAKHTFIAAAEKDGKKLIAVLLNAKQAKDMYEDAKKLFELGFNEQKERQILLEPGKQVDIKLKIPSLETELAVMLKEPVSVDIYPSERKNIQIFVNWFDLGLPIEKGQKVGELWIEAANGQEVAREFLYAFDSLEPDFQHKLKNLDSWLKSNRTILLSLLFLVVIFSLKMKLSSND